jgi:N-acetylmuramoyl-L-alanine amidase
MRVLLSLLLLGCASAAGAAELRELRLWDSPEGTRVIFELDGAPAHQVFTLDNPARIVIDLKSVPASAAKIANRAMGRGLVQRVRSAPRDEGGVRVVLDMAEAVQPKTVLLDPAEGYGQRLVLDLQGSVRTPPPDGEAAAALAALLAAESAPEPRTIQPSAPLSVAPSLRRNQKPIIVAIDAGHGGEDPGAIGRDGLREKDAALAIARKLAQLVNQSPPLKAVLTRDGDYFIELRQRVNRARTAQADLFVSIHANAVTDRSMRGSSIYVLSPRGVHTEHARWLAQKENSADLVGGIELPGKDQELAAVLIDLSQTSTMEASFDIAGRLLGQLGNINTLQYPQVQQAGFAVLKAPDIPSVLVETAFISNPQEERKLGDPDEQERIARSLLDGIRSYFENYRPQRDQDEGPQLRKVRQTAPLEPQQRTN